MSRRIVLVIIMLLVPSPLAAQSRLQRVAVRASIWAAAVAQGVDTSTTMYCRGLADGRRHPESCVEQNALYGSAANPVQFGLRKTAAAGAGLWLTARLGETHPWYAVTINVATTVLIAGVAHHNWQETQRLQRGQR